MERIHQLFKEYRENITEWKGLNHSLMQNMPKDKWKDLLETVTDRKKEIYRENNNFIDELTGIMKESPNEEVIQAVYEETLLMYYEDHNDNFFLVDAFKRLIDYYEEKQDAEHLSELYGGINYALFTTHNLEYRDERMDTSYNDKLCKMIERYEEMNFEVRFRILVGHYYKLVVFMDADIISVEESLRGYKELRDFLDREEIKKLDEGLDRIQYVMDRISSGLLISVVKINKMDRKTWPELYDYIKRYFREKNLGDKEDYELNPMEYACSLFVRFVDGEVSTETCFDKFMDYFEYIFAKMQSEGEISELNMVDSINAVTILTNLAVLLADETRINRAASVFMNFAEGRWIKGNVKVLGEINKMLGRVCISFFSLNTSTIDREKSIRQLIIQRNLYTYLNSILVGELAEAIYSEVIVQYPDYFSSITDIPASQMNHFIRQAATFFDIGTTAIFGTEIHRFRRNNEAERKSLEKHTYIGEKGLTEIPEMKKYLDVIKGHHKYYDGSQGYPENYDNTKSPIKPVVDLIALCVAIQEETDSYVCLDKSLPGFSELMDKIVQGRGVRFAPELVDVIENSILLRDRIQKLVTEGRIDIGYEAYHNWEKIQLGLDEVSLLDEIYEKLRQYAMTHDDAVFEPVKANLMHLIKHTSNNAAKGKALYYLMIYYQLNDEIYEAKKLEPETNHLLSEYGNYELQVNNLLNQGVLEYMNENIEGAISKYLAAIAFAEKLPECKDSITRSYLNIASCYLDLHYYDRALYYYKQAEGNCDTENDTEEIANILCGIGFCSYKLGNVDGLQEKYEKLQTIADKCPRDVRFPIEVFLCYFEHALGYIEVRDKHITQVCEEALQTESFTYIIAEAFIFMELLDSLGRYQEMQIQLDHLLAVYQLKINFHQVYSKLLKLRVNCALKLGNMEDMTKFWVQLCESDRMELAERSRKVEATEDEVKMNAQLQMGRHEMVRENEVLEENIKAAVAANKQKSNFLSSMSHEIRTPINAIIGLNEMILRESTEDQIKQYADDINSSSRQLLGIINDVLDFSKMEAGKMELLPQKYEVRDIGNNIHNMFDSKMKEKNLEFKVVLDENMPSELCGDDLRIRQILINLISNAYKYTKEGAVEFHLGYKHRDEKSILLTCEVKDTGIGLKPDQIEKLAMPFERFDEVNNRSIEGTGLGMSIVYKLLKLMDSKLEVNSIYGQGSSFYFEVIQEVVDWKSLAEIDKKKEQVKTETTSYLQASKAQILAVDDTSINLKVVKGLLKRTGCQVTLANSGFECLELCKENGYHIILLDHMMPEMDGIETLQKIKEQDGLNRDTPIIALTANALNGAEEFYKSQGFDALLTKPINYEELEKALKLFLPQYVLDN